MFSRKNCKRLNVAAIKDTTFVSPFEFNLLPLENDGFSFFKLLPYKFIEMYAKMTAKRTVIGRGPYAKIYAVFLNKYYFGV